jgi:hypothetical protein
MNNNKLEMKTDATIMKESRALVNLIILL